MEYLIIDNKKIGHNYFKLTLDITEDSQVPKPGQFYNLRCGEVKDPLLRRPFSMHRLVSKSGSRGLEILYLVIGKGTEWLSRCRQGERVDAIGPFGNGFMLHEGAQNVVLVARGIGIAPLFSVGEETLKRNKNAEIFFLLGARKKERVFYEKECGEIGDVFFYTDDGSMGFHGRAPELLVHLLEGKKLPDDLALYACGPALMLKDLAEVSRGSAIQGQVALESHMGCGFGACLSCAFPLKPQSIAKNEDWKKPALQWSEDGQAVYSLICKDGPIYDIQEVDWDEWLA